MNRSIFLELLVIFAISIASAQDWQIQGKMPLPVAGGQILAANSSIYILGGFSDSLQKSVDWIQVYHPERNEWEIAGHMATPRRGFVTDFSSDSTVILCGGVWLNSENTSSIEFWTLRRNEITSPHIQNYNEVFNRVYSSGHIYDNYLYMFGGLPAPAVTDSINLGYITRYNLSSAAVVRLQDTLYVLNDLPYHILSARVENLVYLFGGVHFAISNRIFSFNMESFEYKSVGVLPQVRAGGSAVVTNGEIYLIGGYNESGEALAATDIFYPSTNGVYTGPELNFGRVEPMAVKFGDKILVFGGRDRFNQNIQWIESLDIPTGVSSPDETETPADDYSLEANYPNPFNSCTVIHFSIPYASAVSLDIFSMTGQHITSLVQSDIPAGRHQQRWDGRDRYGRAVASGIYIYKLQVGMYLYARKMILIR